MKERQKCPACGNFIERENPDETVCTPHSCNAWKVVGRGTARTASGHRRLLRSVGSRDAVSGKEG